MRRLSQFDDSLPLKKAEFESFLIEFRKMYAIKNYHITIKKIKNSKKNTERLKIKYQIQNQT